MGTVPVRTTAPTWRERAADPEFGPPDGGPWLGPDGLPRQDDPPLPEPERTQRAAPATPSGPLRGPAEPWGDPSKVQPDYAAFPGHHKRGEARAELPSRSPEKRRLERLRGRQRQAEAANVSTAPADSPGRGREPR